MNESKYITVFDITNQGIDISFLIPLVVIIGLILILLLSKTIGKRSKSKFWNVYFNYYARFFSIVALGLATIIFFFALNSSYKKYSFLKKITTSKNYQIVEGPVKNFTELEFSEREMENFSINGIYFEYSDYYINGGYNKTARKGGVIKEDGQWLKLYYYNKDGENRIIKIEKLK